MPWLLQQQRDYREREDDDQIDTAKKSNLKWQKESQIFTCTPSNSYISVFVSCYISPASRLTLHLVHPNLFPLCLFGLLATSGTSPLLTARGMSWGPQLESVGPPKVNPVELSSHPRGASARSAGRLVATGGILRAATSSGPPIGCCCCLCYIQYACRDKLEKKKTSRPHHHSWQSEQ
jgi:hypothetical protein